MMYGQGSGRAAGYYPDRHASRFDWVNLFYWIDAGLFAAVILEFAYLFGK
jgi:hypothetical protein